MRVAKQLPLGILISKIFNQTRDSLSFARKYKSRTKAVANVFFWRRRWQNRRNFNSKILLLYSPTSDVRKESHRRKLIILFGAAVDLFFHSLMNLKMVRLFGIPSVFREIENLLTLHFYEKKKFGQINLVLHARKTDPFTLSRIRRSPTLMMIFSNEISRHLSFKLCNGALQLAAYFHFILLSSFFLCFVIFIYEFLSCLP